MSDKKHSNGNGSNAGLLAFLTKRFDKLDSDVEQLDAQVSTIRDRMATKGGIEDVRQEIEGLEHTVAELNRRVSKLEKPARKSTNGH